MHFLILFVNKFSHAISTILTKKHKKEKALSSIYDSHLNPKLDPDNTIVF
jgi:hypothetical protein